MTNNFDKQEAPYDKLNEECVRLLSKRLATLITKESTQKPKLLPDSVEFERLEQLISRELKQSGENIKEGIQALFDELIEFAKVDRSLYEKEIIPALSILVYSVEKASDINAQQNKTIAEICGLPEHIIEHFYQAGRKIYERKEFEKASKAFTVLTLLDAKRPAFWLALGNSEYFCKNYEKALYAYAIGAFLDPTDPSYHLYSSKCYEATNDIPLAINALDLALFIISENKSLSDLKEAVLVEKKRVQSRS